MLLCIGTLQIRKAKSFKTPWQVKLERTGQDRQTDMPMDSHFNYYDVSKPGNLAFNCLLTWY